MGEEPYYSDILVDELLATVLKPEERDFNQTIVYASDTNSAEIVSLARRYPMFAERQLVVVKEAQTLTKLDVAINIQFARILQFSYVFCSLFNTFSSFKQSNLCPCF